MKEPTTLGRRAEIQPKAASPRASASDTAQLRRRLLSKVRLYMRVVYIQKAKTAFTRRQPTTDSGNNSRTFAQSNLRLRNAFSAKTNFQLVAFPFCNTLTANGGVSAIEKEVWKQEIIKFICLCLPIKFIASANRKSQRRVIKNNKVCYGNTILLNTFSKHSKINWKYGMSNTSFAFFVMLIMNFNFKIAFPHILKNKIIKSNLIW